MRSWIIAALLVVESRRAVGAGPQALRWASVELETVHDAAVVAEFYRESLDGFASVEMGSTVSLDQINERGAGRRVSVARRPEGTTRMEFSRNYIAAAGQ